jgi:hypothetical protein
VGIAKHGALARRSENEEAGTLSFPYGDRRWAALRNLFQNAGKGEKVKDREGFDDSVRKAGKLLGLEELDPALRNDLVSNVVKGKREAEVSQLEEFSHLSQWHGDETLPTKLREAQGEVSSADLEKMLREPQEVEPSDTEAGTASFSDDNQTWEMLKSVFYNAGFYGAVTSSEEFEESIGEVEEILGRGKLDSEQRGVLASSVVSGSRQRETDRINKASWNDGSDLPTMLDNLYHTNRPSSEDLARMLGVVGGQGEFGG